MEAVVERVISEALARLAGEGKVPSGFDGPVIVDRPKREEFGDYGTALPLALAKAMRRPPAECGRMLIEAMRPPDGLFEAITFAPPGYVNFKVRPIAWFRQMEAIAADPGTWGNSTTGGGRRVLLEFVSANPTGPLHVGHCRGAVHGDALARVMRAAGFIVDTEYYINDVGNQMAMLGRSLHARACEAAGMEADFPEKGYHGDYVRELASEYVASSGTGACTPSYSDLGPEDDNPLVHFGALRLIDQIRADLETLGVRFDRWYSERDLHRGDLDDSPVRRAASELLASRHAFRRDDGAIVFRVKDQGEDEDRVVIRGNGLGTYFASDIAYHDEKVRRGYATCINIWGADHHGYIPRMKAALAAFGHDPDILEVLLVQMVTITRGGVVVPVSKRSGKFITLREVVDEVGPDAVRFIFLLRRADAQMEFDLDLARSRSMDNPVFYVQYGHARVASILRKAAALGHSPPPYSDDLATALTLPEESALVRHLCRFPSVVSSAALRREPHHVAFFLLDLVKGFHSYYTRYKHTEKVITADAGKTAARMFLVSAVKAVLARGLSLLGVSAPEEMHYVEEEETAGAAGPEPGEG